MARISTFTIVILCNNILPPGFVDVSMNDIKELSTDLSILEKTAADLAIVGLGPGGLIAALEAVKAKKRVVAFTNRTLYIRGQFIKLSQDARNVVERYYNPLDDQDRILESKILSHSLQTKDLEKFFLRKLQAFGEDNLQIVETKNNPIVTVGEGETGLANYIQLEGGERFYCYNILAADGAKHAFSTLIQRQLNLDIIYQPTLEQERHRYHASLQITACDTSNPELEDFYDQYFIDGQITQQTLNNFLDHFSWEEPYFPNDISIHNNKARKFYIATEIPKTIYDQPLIQRRDSLLKWAGFFLALEYGLDPAYLIYQDSKKTPQKNSLKAVCFDLTSERCLSPVVDLCHGVFAQIGDARRTPNYAFQHGLNDAITGAESFAKALSSSTEFNRPQFEATLYKMDEDFRQNWIRISSSLMKQELERQVTGTHNFNIPTDESIVQFIINVRLFFSILYMSKTKITPNQCNKLLQSDFLTRQQKGNALIYQFALTEKKLTPTMVSILLNYVSDDHFKENLLLDQHLEILRRRGEKNTAQQTIGYKKKYNQLIGDNSYFCETHMMKK